MTTDEQRDLDQATYEDFMAEVNERWQRDFYALPLDEQSNNLWIKPNYGY
jgi:hypothetical protein